MAAVLRAFPERATIRLRVDADPYKPDMHRAVEAHLSLDLARISYTMRRTPCEDSTKMQPVLEIEDLSISFKTHVVDIPAVVDFGLTIMPSETVGLVGESGSGKSTVAFAIMQYLGKNGHITGGAIRYKGQDLVTMPEFGLRKIRGREIAMVYQEPSSSLNPSMKIGQQLAEPLVLLDGLSWEAARTQSRDMLEAVRLPDPDRLMESYPHQISGGQQQRVVIAMALLSKPALLLMDEPTTALDVTVEAGIVELVKDLSVEFGVAVLFISHNLGLIRAACDRVVVMYSGETVEAGLVDTVFDATRHPYTRGLLEALPVPDADKTARTLRTIPGQLPLPFDRPKGCFFGPRCEAFEAGTCDADPIPLMPVAGGTGHFSRCARVADIDWTAREEAAPNRTDGADAIAEVLRIDGLQKYYVRTGGLFGKGGVVRANEDVSFAARSGQTVALVGESGCGKSTLAKVLTGLETATEGEVWFGDQDIAGQGIRQRSDETVRGIQMVFQNPFDTLNPKKRVGRQVMRVLKRFGIGNSTAERRDAMHALFDSVRLPRDFAHRKPRQLSGGQKQRVAIARAFAGNPRLLVADEPLSALDASVQAAVADLLTAMQAEHDTTMLFISHDLSIVHHLSDWVVVMYLGHVVEQGRTHDVFAPPYHPYTEALLSAVPIADNRFEKRKILLEGDIPSAETPPPGCPFQTRCHRKAEAQEAAGSHVCETKMPPVRDLPAGHRVKCHLPESVLEAMPPVIVSKDTGQPLAAAGE
jgi:peptide/nickel transport system ATP-binding protein